MAVILNAPIRPAEATPNHVTNDPSGIGNDVGKREVNEGPHNGKNRCLPAVFALSLGAAGTPSAPGAEPRGPSRIAVCVVNNSGSAAALLDLIAEAAHKISLESNADRPGDRR